MVPSGRVIVTGLAAVVPEGDSSRLLRAVRRLIGTVALQAVIAACRWRRHGLDFTAWLTSEATQDPGKVEICPVRTTDALAPVSGSRQLACGVARARQETNSDISLLCRGPGNMALVPRLDDIIVDNGEHDIVKIVDDLKEWTKAQSADAQNGSA